MESQGVSFQSCGLRDVGGSNSRRTDQKPNALASDEQFVRRVYLDLAGRIPTREEIAPIVNEQLIVELYSKA